MLLSEASGGVSIISFPSVIEASAGTASASFTLLFALMAWIIKKKLSMARVNKKKKHNKIFMLAKSKLNSTETLISPALIGLEISHQVFNTVLMWKKSMEKRKKTMKSSDQLNKEEGKKLKIKRTELKVKIKKIYWIDMYI